MKKLDLKTVKRIVIKIGSNVVSGERGLRASFFINLAEQIAALQKRKIKCVLVSSGAVAAAMSAFRVKQKPSQISEKQAFAAYGQPLLMKQYISSFKRKGLQVAQILLTHPDIKDRKRFLNAKHALNELLRRGIVPIINENDTVAVEELKFGDNDRLSACVADLVGADLLMILSHVDGLFDGDPEINPRSRLIPFVEKIDAKIEALVFRNKNVRGTGGMASKIEASRMAMGFGIPVYITNGMRRDCVTDFFNHKGCGTLFGKK